MGQEIWINGEAEEHEEDKSIDRLKDEAGFPEDDIVVYNDGEENVAVSDGDKVGDIPEGARVASQPGKGQIFG